MTCVPIDRIAAIASGEDADAHVASCTRCRALVDEQREIVSLAQRLPAVPLGAAHRAELAAAVVALADGPASRGRIRYAVAAAALVAAGAIAFVATRPREDVALVPPPPLAEQPLVAEVATSDAKLTRDIDSSHDTVNLHDGKVTIDSRKRKPVHVIASDTTIAIANARVDVIARHGVIMTARVFDGTAEVIANGKHVVIARGDVWERPVEKRPAPATPESSVAAFRDGWEALHAGRNRDAIAQFDRAKDPVVAEDAAFWAGIAAERDGQRDEAVRRMTAFLAAYPDSPRVDAARAALERLR